ncbi:hypothetical protein [Tychonema sp. LEGE 07203]|uniref:hypothetical protein n=1 Tax=Tychonema sp. LEGE 07203 TaxID=1828671 RepID=UPI0019E22DAF|nr:hypothetical protein [Tychonema sp. LEGE 07203]MBE9094611.1 hypothetical protein [Tychonema sp. LEGE 07203]
MTHRASLFDKFSTELGDRSKLKNSVFAIARASLVIVVFYTIFQIKGRWNWEKSGASPAWQKSFFVVVAVRSHYYKSKTQRYPKNCSVA